MRPKQQNQIAFIDHLPVELLCHIFELSQERVPTYNDFHAHLRLMAPNQSPLNIIQVSRLWRAVALGSPSLWDSIHPTLSSVAFMKRWLDISPKVPFHLSIATGSVGHSRYPVEHARSIFQLFIGVVDRWKSLSIALDAAFAEDMVTLISTSRTRLHIEDLNVIFAGHDHTPSTLERFVSLLPSLGSLKRLKWTDERRKVSVENIPWSQLEVIDLASPISANQCLWCLERCTSATMVSFTIDSSSRNEVLWSPPLPMPPISLPKLTSLTLSRSCDPMRVAKYFVFPSLHYLNVEIQHRDHAELQRMIIAAPGLKTLVVHEFDLRKEENPASDTDIIDYLTNPYISRLPQVEVTFRQAHNRGLHFIDNLRRPHTVLPRLLCWVGRRCGLPYIGWGPKIETSDALIWKYADGHLEYTPRYEVWAKKRI